MYAWMYVCMYVCVIISFVFVGMHEGTVYVHLQIVYVNAQSEIKKFNDQDATIQCHAELNRNKMEEGCHPRSTIPTNRTGSNGLRPWTARSRLGAKVFLKFSTHLIPRAHRWARSVTRKALEWVRTAISFSLWAMNN